MPPGDEPWALNNAIYKFKNVLEFDLDTNDKINIDNFIVDYKESGGWGCCYDNFFEVWKK